MNIYTGADNIITSLGFTSRENFLRIRSGKTGIETWNDSELYPGTIAASRLCEPCLQQKFRNLAAKKDWLGSFTRMEKMFLVSMSAVIDQSGIDAKDLQIIFSTTKGNIDLLDRTNQGKFEHDRLFLWKMAEVVAKRLGIPHKPVLVSNACISGSMAIIMASRMIRDGKCKHVLVTGGDMVTEFVASGFQSFQALSPTVCKPFDADRDGLSLGEGVGTLLLTNDPALAAGHKKIIVAGGSVSNDANHISGPSRDGEGLWIAIHAAMKEAVVTQKDIGFISAHGTATPYNDEMEAKALARAGLQQAPVNSFKGNLGHTLGAAGVIETILTLHSMQEGILIRSLGYGTHGVSTPLNIITENRKTEIPCALKTASGFGGCNAAIVLRSINPA
jgi:3-oxoacyl-[acyl-carrier-protein] synthase-1